jgi:hypothetical protein
MFDLLAQTYHRAGEESREANRQGRQDEKRKLLNPLTLGIGQLTWRPWRLGGFAVLVLKV